MKRAAMAARRDAVRDMLRDGAKLVDVRRSLRLAPNTVARLARTVEVRR
jgi:hypothetical protein